MWVLGICALWQRPYLQKQSTVKSRPDQYLNQTLSVIPRYDFQECYPYDETCPSFDSRIAEKYEGRFANSILASGYLVRGSRECRAADLQHHANIWKAWSSLTEVVKSGKPSADASEKPEDEYHDFVSAMHDFAWELTHLLAEAFDLSSVESMLDLGGGLDVGVWPWLGKY